MTTGTKRIAMLLAAGVVATSVAAAPASSAAPCAGRTARAKAGNMEVIGLRTLHVVMRAAKKSYERGDTVKVFVTVTRPAHEDPADLGIEFEPPASFPAEDIDVGVGITAGQAYFGGYGKTNAEGKATIRIKIESYAGKGWAVADGYAYREQADAPCFRVEEDGYTSRDRFFKVTS